MQGWLIPKGPESPRTYWVRRVVVVLVLAGLIAVIAQLIRPNDDETTMAVVSSPEAGQEHNAPNPGEPTVNHSPVVSPSPTIPQPELPPPACDPNTLGLQIDGSNPLQTDAGNADFVITLLADQPACDLDLAAHPVSLEITSGADRIWASTDCGDWQPVGILQLTGSSPQQLGIGWPVRRSSGCELVDAQLGAGTYVATASLGGQTASLVFQLQG